MDAKLLLLMVMVALGITLTYGEVEISVSIFSSIGSYAISFNNSLWLPSAKTYFYINGTRYATDDGSINATVTVPTGTSGLDTLGPWQDTTFQYKADGTTINARIKTYQTKLVPAFIFEQTYVNGAKGTKAANVNQTIGGFPSFTIQDNTTNLGYLAYAADMVGDREKQLGIWTNKTVHLKDGLHGTGPIVIFDKNGNTILIAPLTNPLTVSTFYDTTDYSLSWGVMGGIDDIPPGYTISTMVVYSEDGINDVFEKWGKMMKIYYDKQTEYQLSDITLSHLGYWTDNGAYYYYHPEQNKNFEETLADIKNYTQNTQIPYQYFQLDSWWYYKDATGAVTKWEAKPDIFPSGMKKLQTELKIPFGLHNRYWSKDTPYADKYLFLKGDQLSVPLTTEFWDFLFERAKTWGMTLYEQDWMYVQFMQMESMKSNLTLHKTWLDMMAASAVKNKLTIQYCMTQSRQALQSLQYSAVTQARVSGDYHSTDNQWKIGISSLFAHAIGIRPSKDTFWTTSNQPGNPGRTTEPYPALQTLVAVLSTGPVGPSDGIGYTDKTLLMKCCNAGGLILKPSKPATAIDDQIRENAFKDGTGANGQVWTTYSDFGDYNPDRFGIIMVADLSKPYSITPKKASFNVGISKFPESMIYDSENISNRYMFSEDSPFTLPPCLLTNTTNYCLYYTSPVYTHGSQQIVLLGETNKFVPMSPQRIFKIWKLKDSFAVTLQGTPGENVTFVYLLDGVIKTTFNIIDKDTQCSTIIIYGQPLIPKDLNCRYQYTHYPEPRPKHAAYESKSFAINIAYSGVGGDGFYINFLNPDSR